jgi:hypothetical protein
MQLLLEHAALSDVLFGSLLVAGVAALAWRRTPQVASTVLGGLLLGLATLVRIVGEPTVVLAALFLLLVATTWRARVLHALLVCLAFALPLVGYATWYHQENGAWAITQAGGRALYMRTTTFVDCAKLDPPSYEKVLCPKEPVGQRQDPTWYGWHSRETVPALVLPPGVTRDHALRDFAVRAIKAQPGDYARIVLRDFALGFRSWDRQDHDEYSTSVKWTFDHYVGYEPTPGWTQPAFASHGGMQPVTREPIARMLGFYGRHVYVVGPLALAILALAVAGLVVRRREERSVRPLALLTLGLALMLVAIPDATAEFVWRYQLPLLTLLPMSAALGWTRLRQPAVATASTD